MQKSSKPFLEIIAIVSSADVGSNKGIILRSRSFICIMNSNGPGIGAWQTPCFYLTQPD
jgi:hypothetical protein